MRKLYTNCGSDGVIEALKSIGIDTEEKKEIPSIDGVVDLPTGIGGGRTSEGLHLNLVDDVRDFFIGGYEGRLDSGERVRLYGAQPETDRFFYVLGFQVIDNGKEKYAWADFPYSFE